MLMQQIHSVNCSKRWNDEAVEEATMAMRMMMISNNSLH